MISKVTPVSFSTLFEVTFPAINEVTELLNGAGYHLSIDPRLLQHSHVFQEPCIKLLVFVSIKNVMIATR